MIYIYLQKLVFRRHDYLEDFPHGVVSENLSSESTAKLERRQQRYVTVSDWRVNERKLTHHATLL